MANKQQASWRNMELKGQKILFLIENDYEDLELHYPKLRLQEAGAKTVIAGPKAKETYHSKHGYPCQTDIAFDTVKVKEFNALIIPGGYAPDKLRAIPKVLEIVKEFNQAKKLIAFICHAGWVPASAAILNKIKCTSWHSIKDDLIHAGAQWKDAAVVVDQHFISSRSPDDLPQFCSAIIEFLSQFHASS